MIWKQIVFIFVTFAGICLLPELNVAQSTSTSCDLRLRVYEKKLDGKPEDSARSFVMDESTQLRNASATARKQGSKQVLRSTALGETPVFRTLTEGKYEVTVSRQGYRRVKQIVTVDCDWANRENILYENVSLNFGDVRETPELAPEKFTVRGDRSFGTDADSPGVEITVDLSERPRPVPPGRRPIPRQISGGVLNSKALVFPKPPYPPAARAVRASGAVSVQVLIDENGDVISASAVSGHPLLRSAAVQAARNAKFAPTKLQGQPVKVSGVITYNFVP